MFEPTTKEQADALLNAPMVEWSELQHGLFRETEQEIIHHLDAVIERAARLRAYLDVRIIGGDHNRAVRRQNALATKIRRELGYSAPRQDVIF